MNLIHNSGFDTKHTNSGFDTKHTKHHKREIIIKKDKWK
jgi:hypothetical protein